MGNSIFQWCSCVVRDGISAVIGIWQKWGIAPMFSREPGQFMVDWATGDPIGWQNGKSSFVVGDWCRRLVVKALDHRNIVSQRLFQCILAVTNGGDPATDTTHWTPNDEGRDFDTTGQIIIDPVAARLYVFNYTTGLGYDFSPFQFEVGDVVLRYNSDARRAYLCIQNCDTSLGDPASHPECWELYNDSREIGGTHGKMFNPTRGSGVGVPRYLTAVQKTVFSSTETTAFPSPITWQREIDIDKRCGRAYAMAESKPSAKPQMPSFTSSNRFFTIKKSCVMWSDYRAPWPGDVVDIQTQSDYGGETIHPGDSVRLVYYSRRIWCNPYGPWPTAEEIAAEHWKDVAWDESFVWVSWVDFDGDSDALDPASSFRARPAFFINTPGWYLLYPGETVTLAVVDASTEPGNDWMFPNEPSGGTTVVSTTWEDLYYERVYTMGPMAWCALGMYGSRLGNPFICLSKTYTLQVTQSCKLSNEYTDADVKNDAECLRDMESLDLSKLPTPMCCVLFHTDHLWRDIDRDYGYVPSHPCMEGIMTFHLPFEYGIYWDPVPYGEMRWVAGKAEVQASVASRVVASPSGACVNVSAGTPYVYPYTAMDEQYTFQTGSCP